MYKHRKDIFKVPKMLPISFPPLCNKIDQSEPFESNSQLLRKDETLFQGLDFDNIPGVLSESDISCSTVESLELNLNDAIIASNSLKRKSTEGISTKCKKRLHNAVSDDISVTDTELMHINLGDDKNDELNSSRPNSFEEHFSASLLYFNTQFSQDDSIANFPQYESSQTTIELQSEQNPLNMCVKQLNLTQMFNDDIEEEQQQLTEELNIQSSQLFLDVAKRVTNVPVHSSQKLEDLTGTTYKSKNASMYIQLQRSMEGKSEDNLSDDNFVAQYRSEIEGIFKDCEKSISSIVNSYDGTSRSADHNEDLNVSDDVLAGLNDINWNSQFATPDRDHTNHNMTMIPSSTPSSIVKRRITEFSKIGDMSLKAQLLFIPSIETTGFYPMGPFFGLPNKVKTLIKEYKGIEELYDWQKECLTLPAVSLRNNLIYALPTSGGKTLVAEVLIIREVLCRRKNCLFILPYVSIVQEKIWALSPFAVQLNFLLEEYAAGKGRLPPVRRREKKSVYIATIEKGLALIESLIEDNRANEIGLIVVDELHIIGEPGRGAALEALLTKVMFIKAGIQIVGMSATIGNLNEIATFLNADVYTRDFRPVELKEYIKCGSDILSVNPSGKSPEEIFSVVRTVNYGYKDEVLRRDPDHLAGLVNEVIPNGSCLVFCSSKKNCENVALLLSQILPRTCSSHRQNERAHLKSALKGEDGTLCSILSQTIPNGIAYHHSGLTTDERRHIEEAYRVNIICVICCTSTLAAGVNLPAKRVIIRAPYIGRDFLTLSRYKQMVGRAGRAGMGDNGESITILQTKDSFRMIQLLTAPMDEAASSLHLDDYRGLRSLILSSIGLNLSICLSDFKNLLSKTLLAVQAERLHLNMEDVANDTIKHLFKLKALTVSSIDQQSTSASNIEVQIQLNSSVIEKVSRINENKSQKKFKNVILKPSTELSITRLGKASFKSNIDLYKSQVIYNDLKQAQQSLVLLDHLHLLYIVTPYEPIDVNVYIDMNVYYTQYLKLTPTQMHTAKTLGITEFCAMKMATGKAFKPDVSRTVHRFFFTLILNEIWQQKSIHEVSKIFNVNRGVVQNLTTASASYASSVLRYCEELEEFWAFSKLLGAMVQRLSYCCSTELLPLMELPCVKIGRAKQLYSNGFKRLEDVAKSTVQDLVEKIEYLSHRVAKQLIMAAKVLLLERVETLRGEVQQCLDVLNGNNN